MENQLSIRVRKSNKMIKSDLDIVRWIIQIEVAEGKGHNGGRVNCEMCKVKARSTLEKGGGGLEVRLEDGYCSC